MNFKSKGKRFILYTGASTVAMVVDLFLFILFAEIILSNVNADISILLSTIIARATSSMINFKLSKMAFQSKNLKKSAAFRFFGFIICQLLLSAFLVMFIYRFIKIPKTIIKCMVDTTLYVVFYKINSKYVFKGREIIETMKEGTN